MKTFPLVLLALFFVACSSDSGSNAEPDSGAGGDSSLTEDTGTIADSGNEVDVAEDIALPDVIDVREDASSPDTLADTAEPDVEEVAEDILSPDTAQDTVDPDTGVDTTDEVAEPETMTDVDGNVYATVRIGDQVWMAENLKVTRFDDGTPIPMWEFGDDWYFVPEPAPFYRLADTSDLNNRYEQELPEDYHGAVYNEAVLRSERLAPDGWRMPTPADFEQLEAFLIADGQEGNVATALKANEGWSDFAGNGDDLYGFRALAAGYVSIGGTATGASAVALWATTAVDEEASRRTVVTLAAEEALSFDQNSILLGAPVRLIRE